MPWEDYDLQESFRDPFSWTQDGVYLSIDGLNDLDAVWIVFCWEWQK